MKGENKISEEAFKVLKKVENPTLKEILELSKKLNLDKMVLVKFFIEKEKDL
ncbi:hypothetical protein [Paeniclostridium hominis]|uniref:hypothetical protein n=1 Tax=Paeniclostridium hominis TaxID=2764329 RepID=UPI0022E8FCAA|nr:hypothetical protein [Paeniclostridium hominis]